MTEHTPDQPPQNAPVKKRKGFFEGVRPEEVEPEQAPPIPETPTEPEPVSAPAAKATPTRRSGVNVALRPTSTTPTTGAQDILSPAPPRRPTRTTPSNVTAGEGPYKGVSYQLDATSQEPRNKDSGMRMTASFKKTMQSAHRRWMVEHDEDLEYPPTFAAFLEGVLRVGLKHLHDDEFEHLIPPDMRRR